MSLSFILLSIVIGLIPAMIAQSKGRSFIAWWLYGAMLFLIALVHAILIKKDVKHEEEKVMATGNMKKCPYCAELIKSEAVKCKHCGSDLLTKHEEPVKTDDDYLEEARRKAGLS